MKNIKDTVKNIFRLPDFTIERVTIKKEVVEDITTIARQTHPLEFTALLSGSIQKKTLRIIGLVYQQYQASEHATAMHFNLPMIHNTFGSVHSHPGFSNRPSGADLRFFNKHGVFHIIICMPYTRESMQAYDKSGNMVEFGIEEDN
ncbi:MAG: Mov34/MPN/PAD-1 family protein [Nanoarchaeota archaeon]